MLKTFGARLLPLRRWMPRDCEPSSETSSPGSTRRCTRQLVNALVDRAARNNASGWIPDGPTSDAVDEIVRFAEAAQSVGYAYPAAVDNYLGQGSNAFLAKDYRAAFRIFHALLIPMGSGDMSTKCLEPMGEFTQTFPA